MEFKQNSEEIIMQLQKNAEKTRNRIIIPQFFINEYGSKFYMIVYKDKIVLKPIKKKGE